MSPAFREKQIKKLEKIMEEAKYMLPEYRDSVLKKLIDNNKNIDKSKRV